MKHNTLFINTSDSKETRIALIMDGKRYEKTTQSIVLKSQSVLPLIETLLTEHHLGLPDVTDIELYLGPGSFTGLRVGAAIANALGFLLHIPVNGKQALALPRYW